VLPLFVYLFTSGAGTAYPSGAPEFTSVFSGVKAFQSSLVYDGRELQPVYVLLIVVCPFVLFPLAIVLSVLLRYTYSDCLLAKRKSTKGINQLKLILCTGYVSFLSHFYRFCLDQQFANGGR
jgi:hypothetical protein